MKAEKGRHSLLPPQPGNVDVQVHPVDTFDLQGDAISQASATLFGTLIFGSGTTPILGDRLLRRLTSLARTACGSPLSTGAICELSRTASQASEPELGGTKTQPLGRAHGTTASSTEGKKGMQGKETVGLDLPLRYGNLTARSYNYADPHPT